MALTTPTLTDTGATCWAAVSVIIGLDKLHRQPDRVRQAAGDHEKPANHVPLLRTCVNAALLAIAAVLAVCLHLRSCAFGPLLAAIAIIALALGVLMVIPIGGGDTRSVISLHQLPFTGVAAAATGFDLLNPGPDRRRHPGRRLRHDPDYPDVHGP